MEESSSSSQESATWVCWLEFLSWFLDLVWCFLAASLTREVVWTVGRGMSLAAGELRPMESWRREDWSSAVGVGVVVDIMIIMIFFLSSRNRLLSG